MSSNNTKRQISSLLRWSTSDWKFRPIKHKFYDMSLGQHINILNFNFIRQIDSFFFLLSFSAKHIPNFWFPIQESADWFLFLSSLLLYKTFTIPKKSLFFLNFRLVNSYSGSLLLCGSLRNPISGFMILEIGILFFVVVRWRTHEKWVIGVSDKKKRNKRRRITISYKEIYISLFPMFSFNTLWAS